MHRGRLNAIKVLAFLKEKFGEEELGCRKLKRLRNLSEQRFFLQNFQNPLEMRVGVSSLYLRPLKNELYIEWQGRSQGGSLGARAPPVGKFIFILLTFKSPGTPPPPRENFSFHIARVSGYAPVEWPSASNCSGHSRIF